MKPREPQKLSDVLPGLLKKLGLEERAADVTLGPLWKDAVGPGLADHTKPMRFQNGCLWVVVDAPVWKMELERYYKGKILQKLCAKDARIKNLRFQVGSLS